MNYEIKRASDRFQVFQPTEPKTKYLWHIMPSWKLTTFLDGGLWLARIDQFGDPREGTLPIPNLGLLNKLPPIQIPDVQKEYELGIERAYASCWHMSDGDPSKCMWSIGCIGLKTTPDLMKQTLQYISGTDGPVYFGQIRYIDHCKNFIPDGNVIEATFVVRKDYKKENEARVLVYTHGTVASVNLQGKKGPYGDLVSLEVSLPNKCELVGAHNKGKAIVLNIDPSQFIEEIVIHHSTKEDKRQHVISLLRKMNLEDKLRT